MKEKVYLAIREHPQSYVFQNPHRIDVSYRFKGETNYLGSWEGNIDYDKVGTEISLRLMHAGLEDRELVLPEIENEMIDSLEEVLKLHSANRVFRGSLS